MLRKAFKVNDFIAFIETGTHKGQMVAALKGLAQKVVSIELSSSYAQAAQDRFSSDDHVHILQGDSSLLFPETLAEQNGPCLIWLDAHYSGGDTAMGEVESPVLDELKAVLSSPWPHFVWIDDARCFNGENGYPTLAQLKLMLREKYLIEVYADMIRCYPRGKTE